MNRPLLTVVLAIVFTTFSFTSVFSQNDNCAMATAIPLAGGTGSATLQTTTAATVDGPATTGCAAQSATDVDVWFTFTTVGSDIDITLNNTGAGDLFITLYEGTCAGFIELGCEGGVTDQLVITNTLDCNTTYYIKVSSPAGMESDFDISIINDTTCPINNDCAMPTVLTHGACLSGETTVGGNANINIPGCLTDMDVVVWYSFVAQGPDIEMSFDMYAGLNPAVVIFDGATCPPTTIVENCAVTDLLTVDNNATLIAGNTYLIAVGSTGGAEGTFDFCFNNWPIPSNDDPCTPTSLVVDGPPISETFFGSDGDISSCNPNTMNTLFYEFTIPAGTPIFEVIINFPSAYANGRDIEFTLLTDLGVDCANPLVYSSDCVSSPMQGVLLCVEPGTTYGLLIGSELDDQGNFDIEITSQPTPTCEENNYCEFAQDLSVIPSDCMPHDFLGECNTDACPDTYMTGGCDLTLGATVWYEFTTDANPDLATIDIELTNAPAGTFMTFVTNQDCVNPLSICSNDNNDGDGSALTELDIDVSADPAGTTYYFSVTSPPPNPTGGTYDIAITAEPLPANDDPCPTAANPPIFNAQGAALVYSGSNCCAIGANDDPAADIPNLNCSTVTDDDAVWFMFTPSGVHDGVEITVTPGGGPSSLNNGSLEVYTGTTTAGCNGSFNNLMISECSSFPVTLEVPECLNGNPNLVYWIKLTSEEMECGAYSINIMDINVCDYADECDEVNLFPALTDVTGELNEPTCYPGCLDLACPETGPASPFCNFGNIPVVWFQVDTDANAAQLFVEITSAGNWDPVYALFEESPDCTDMLTPVPLVGALTPCSSIVNGNAFDQGGVSGSSTYWLAVGGENVDFSDPNFNPNFDLCLISTVNLIECLPQTGNTTFTLDGVTVGDTGWNPNDPANLLCQGETYEVCIDFFYDASQTGADWLIGVIPTFGVGWETVDPNTVVITATSANNNYAWFEEAPGNPLGPILQEPLGHICTYVNPTTGLLEICNFLSEGSCPQCPNGLGMLEGDPLPGGWFWVTTGNNAGCDNDGSPGEGWGIGTTTVTINLCIDLTVREFVDVADCQNNGILSFSIMPFSDGIAGCWEDPTGECGLDRKQVIAFAPQCDVPPHVIHDNPGGGNDAVCSGEAINVQVSTEDNSPLDIVWTAIDNPNVTGETISPWGMMPPYTNFFPGGTGTISDVLVNTSLVCQTVVYEMFAYDPSNMCPGPIDEIMVLVYPVLSTMGGPFFECESGMDVQISTSVPTGDCGSSNYSYNWTDASGNFVANTNPWTLMQPQPAGTQTYNVTVTSDDGCSAETTVDVTFYPEMTFNFIESNFSTCIDGVSDGICIELDQTNVGGTGPYNFNNVSWSSSPPGIIVSLPFPENQGKFIIDEESGSPFQSPYTITASYTDINGCEGSTDLMLTLSQPPTASLTLVGNPPCDNGTAITFDLLAIGVPIGVGIPVMELFDSAGNLIATVNASNHTFQVTQSDTYTLVVTDAAGCTETVTLVVQAETAPAVVINDVTICEDDDATLTIVNSADYNVIEWETMASTASIMVTPAATTTYLVTVTDANGCMNQGSGQVVVNLNPVLQFSGSTSYCSSTGSTTLTGSGASSYEWLDSAGGIIGSDEMITISSPGNYTLVGYSAENCSAELMFTVIEDSNLSPSISGGDLCDAGSIDLVAGAGFDSYTWEDSGGNMLGSLTDDIISVSSADTYSLTVTDATGCTGSTSFTVSLFDTPSATVTPSVTVCNDGSSGNQTDVNFNAQVSGAAGEWFDTDLSGVDLNNLSSVDFNGFAAGDCFDFTYTTNTATLPCLDQPYVMEICVQNCTCPSTGVPADLCSQGSLPFDLTSLELATTGDGVWTFNTGPDAITLINEVFDPMGVTAGTYTFDFTFDTPPVAPCPAVITQSIDVFAQPDFVITSDDVACNTTANGGSTTVDLDNYVSPGAQSGTWSTATSLTIDGNNEVDFDMQPIGATYVFTFTSDDATPPCTNPSGSITITILDCPPCPPIFLQGETLCNDGVVYDLSNSSVGSDPGSWTCFSCPSSVNVTTGSLDPSGVDAGDYILEYTLDNPSMDPACTASDQVTIIVNAVPTASIPSVINVCSDPAQANTVVDFYGLISSGDTGGIWENTDMIPGLGSDYNMINFAGVVDGTYTFTYTTNSAVAPCMDVPYAMDVIIADNCCPSTLLGAPPAICNDGGAASTVILDDYKITTELGSWTDANGDPVPGGVYDANGVIPGTYTFTFTLTNPDPNPQCIPFSTLDIEVLEAPSTGQGRDTTLCEFNGAVFSLFGLLTDEAAGGNWYDDTGTQLPDEFFDPNGLGIGTYSFEYSFKNIDPCEDVGTFVNVIIDPNPNADAGMGGTIDCGNSSVILDASNSSGGTPPLSFAWSEASGLLISNPTDPVITVTDGGTYTVEVMDNNGCMDADQAIVMIDGNLPTFTIDVTSPDCEGDEPGSIIIDNITGGTPPIQFSIDGGTSFSSDMAYYDLDPNTYIVVLRDAAGCETQQTGIILPANNPIVTLPVVTEILELGDSYVLSLLDNYNSNPDVIDGIVWTEDGVEIYSGPYQDTLIVTPSASAVEYCVTITDDRGCITSDCVRISTRVTKSVYIASVFSTTSDTGNDKFFPQSPDMASIPEFFVFDRWGERVFGVEDIDPNLPANADGSYGWDGKFKEQNVVSGVYVYLIRVIYNDGEEELFVGDITVLH